MRAISFAEMNFRVFAPMGGKGEEVGRGKGVFETILRASNRQWSHNTNIERPLLIQAFPRFPLRAFRDRRWNYRSPFRIRFIKQYFLTLRDPFACAPSPVAFPPMNTGIQWEVAGEYPVYSFTLAPRCRAHLRHASWLTRNKNEQLITDTTHSFSFAFSEAFLEQSAWNGVPEPCLIINDAQLLKVYYGLYVHFRLHVARNIGLRNFALNSNTFYSHI